MTCTRILVFLHVAFVPTNADVIVVVGVPAVAGSLFVASVPVDPGVPISAVIPSSTLL